MSEFTKLTVAVDQVASDHEHDIIFEKPIEGAGFPTLLASVYSGDRSERDAPGYISPKAAHEHALRLANLWNMFANIEDPAALLAEVREAIGAAVNLFDLAMLPLLDTLLAGELVRVKTRLAALAERLGGVA